MNFIHEYALLVAVSLPVAVVVAMQAYLFLNGERGTLLLPGFGAFPKVEIGAMEPAAVDVSPAKATARPVEFAVNDLCEEAA